jgi:hypothetical protein
MENWQDEDNNSVDGLSQNGAWPPSPTNSESRRRSPRLRIARRREGKVVRQRRLSELRMSDSSTEKTGRPTRRRKSKARSPPQERQRRAFLEDVVVDAWKMFVGVLRLARTSYPVWKWLFLLYLVWLLFVYIWTGFFGYLSSSLKPMCSIPILGSKLPFCVLFDDSFGPSVDVAKVADSQKELSVVMGHVGRSFQLATGMVGHEFVIRDLKIRVASSGLPRARELAKELETLSRYTRLTAK